MRRPLDLRLDRAEGRRTAAATERNSTAMRRRGVWRAEAAIGEVIRDALAALVSMRQRPPASVSPTKPPQ